MQPRPDGLPNRLVLSWFPLTVLVGMLCLTALRISGSSTGQWRLLLGQSSDPDLIAGTTRAVRSDEWLAQSSWIVSQVTQGFPARNRVFPGGMDATVFNDLPNRDWSTAFRPHLWGFAASLDQGMALRWWLPAALILIFAYVLVVSLLPRQVLLAVALAVAALWQPALQWWFMPVTLLPVAFAFAAMVAVVWCIRSETRAGRLIPAAIAGYLAVAMAMSIYVPYILAGLIAAVAFATGFILDAVRHESIPLKVVARRLVPLLGAGVGAGAVMAAFVLTRRDTVDAVLGTVYPGQRLIPTGVGKTPQLVELLSGPFQRSLQLDVVDGFVGGNQSEASTPVLVSLFLVIPMLWLIAHQLRRGMGLDWLLTALVALQVVLLAYTFVPGWDALAHLLLLDRSPPWRLRPTFVILAVVSVAVVGERLRRLELRVPWPLSLTTGAAVVASTAFVWHELASAGSAVVPSAYAIVLTAVIAVAVVALARRFLLTGGILLLACAAVMGAGVNPIYRGVVDLGSDTAAGREIKRIAADDPSARWVGVGSAISMATVAESGVHGYSGVQTYPSKSMWNQIDPSHSHEDAWNRLAHVYWSAGAGDPAPFNPQADVIRLTFDSCATFAQKHVAYVLADGRPLDQPCATQIAAFQEGTTPQWIYRVDPAR